MHIEYQISESDYVNAVKLFRRTRRGYWLQRYVMPAVYAILLLLMLLAAILLHNRTSIILIPEMFLLGREILKPLLVRRRLGKQYRDNLSIQSRNFVDVDQTGSRMRDLATDHFTAWAEFSGYVENATTFLRLRKNKTKFSITPKRELRAEQIDEFRSLCKQHLTEQVVGPTRRGLIQGVLMTVSGVAIVWFGALPLFWFYGVGYAMKHFELSATTPKPVNDLSVARLDGPTLSAYGCSIQSPFPSQPEPPSIRKANLTRSKTGSDDDEKATPPQNQYSQALADRDLVVMALDPKGQIDALASLRRARGSFAQNVRDNFGSTIMASPYEYMRSVLYAQPSDARLLDFGRRNHRVFQLLNLKKSELRTGNAVYDLNAGSNRGFQFGDVNAAPSRIRLELFDAQDHHASFKLSMNPHGSGPLTQAHVNAMAASFRCQ